MGRPNAVESSPYQKEIEEMIKEGKPDTDIARWLKKKGAPISRQTINNYKNTKFNITLAARKKYNEKKSKERLDEAADEQVKDIEKIDKDCDLIDTFINEIDPSIIENMDEKDVARLLNNLLKTKDQKLRTKYQILGIIKETSDVTVRGKVEHKVKAVLPDGVDEKVVEEFGLFLAKRGTIRPVEGSASEDDR
jgi:DNA-directed RNA polymerase specialized sigma54-like protein